MTKITFVTKRHCKTSGFSLVELLVTLLVLGLLVMLITPAFALAKSRSRRIACLSNLRQLSLATMLYAGDDSRGSLSAKEDSEDQDLNWLFPYVKSRQIFVCPNTKNVVRDTVGIAPFSRQSGYVDLFSISTSRSSIGMSYQGFGFLGVGVERREIIPVFGGTKTITGIRKSLTSVNTYTHYHNSFNLKGVVPGPSSIWIITDNALPGLWYYPDNLDNHSDSGSNVAFCDGHVEWVQRAAYVYKYELSQDENRVDVSLTWN